MTKTAFDTYYYFVTDVETSALEVGRGDVLSIGAAVMDQDGHMMDAFYERISVRLPEIWFDDDSPFPGSDTCEWWRSAHPFARAEAYFDTSLERTAPVYAASKFRNWVLDFGEDPYQRFFVASPSTFDWKWVESLMMTIDSDLSFMSYHPVDLWSGHMFAKWAADVECAERLDPYWRFDKAVPTIPHHPLSDAFAAAVDLSHYLPNALIDLDEPHYPGWEEWKAENGDHS